MKAQGILVEIIMSGIWKNIKNNEIKPSEWFIHVKKEDLSAKSQEILSIFDADKNGYIDKEEVASIFSNKQEYENLDKNSLFEFKSEVYSLIRKSNSSQIAQEFYDIADNNYGSNSMQKMKELLDGEITQYNILDVLDAYDSESIRKGDSSIIDTIISEVGAGSVLSSKAFFNKSAEQKAVLTDILDKLCIAAYESGVSDEDIEYARNEFISSMNKELGAWQRKTNPKEMEKAIDFLRGAILATKNSTADINESDAKKFLAKNFQSDYATAQEQFDSAKNGVDADGDGKQEGGWNWAAKTGDWVCGLFGCNTIKDLEKKLGDNAKYATLLLEAAENGEALDETTGKKLSFNEIYKKVTGGIDFDPKKIGAAQEANDRFQSVIDNGGDITASNIAVYEGLISKLENAKNDEEAFKLVKNTFNWSDKELYALLDSLGEVHRSIELLAGDKGRTFKLLNFFKNKKEEQESYLKSLTGGQSMEQLQKETELLNKSAYGTNDLIKDVTQFNENMVMTETITIAAAEIAGTVALSLVPGVGQVAMGKLAASAANWGTKGVKIAKYAKNLQKGCQVINKVQTGDQFTSKMAKYTAKAGSAITNTAVATSAVNLSAGKELEESLRKALTNSLFAGVGVTANTLAPILMKTLGVSMPIATEIAEEVLNVGGSYLVTKANGAEYTNLDAFIDLAVGLAIARISGSSKVDISGNTVKTADIPTATTIPTSPKYVPSPTVKAWLEKLNLSVEKGELTLGSNKIILNENSGMIIKSTVKKVNDGEISEGVVNALISRKGSGDWEQSLKYFKEGVSDEDILKNISDQYADMSDYEAMMDLYQNYQIEESPENALKVLIQKRYNSALKGRDDAAELMNYLSQNTNGAPLSVVRYEVGNTVIENLNINGKTLADWLDICEKTGDYSTLIANVKASNLDYTFDWPAGTSLDKNFKNTDNYLGGSKFKWNIEADTGSAKGMYTDIVYTPQYATEVEWLMSSGTTLKITDAWVDETGLLNFKAKIVK